MCYILRGGSTKESKCSTHHASVLNRFRVKQTDNNRRRDGEALASCYDGENFDGYPITAKFVERKGDPEDLYPLPDEEWMVKHCRYGQFRIQVVKHYLLLV